MRSSLSTACMKCSASTLKKSFALFDFKAMIASYTSAQLTVNSSSELFGRASYLFFAVPLGLLRSVLKLSANSLVISSSVRFPLMAYGRLRLLSFSFRMFFQNFIESVSLSRLIFRYFSWTSLFWADLTAFRKFVRANL